MLSTEEAPFEGKSPLSLPESIPKLVNIIQENTAILNQYLETNELPRPTFSPKGPLQFPAPPDAEEIQNARSAIISATQTLHDLLIGPAAILESIHVNRRGLRLVTYI
jgi:hypothetical protein